MTNNMVSTHKTDQNRSNWSGTTPLVEKKELVQNNQHCQKPSINWSKKNIITMNITLLKTIIMIKKPV